MGTTPIKEQYYFTFFNEDPKGNSFIENTVINNQRKISQKIENSQPIIDYTSLKE